MDQDDEDYAPKTHHKRQKTVQNTSVGAGPSNTWQIRRTTSGPSSWIDVVNTPSALPNPSRGKVVTNTNRGSKRVTKGTPVVGPAFSETNADAKSSELSSKQFHRRSNYCTCSFFRQCGPCIWKAERGQFARGNFAWHEPDKTNANATTICVRWCCLTESA